MYKSSTICGCELGPTLIAKQKTAITQPPWTFHRRLRTWPRWRPLEELIDAVHLWYQPSSCLCENLQQGDCEIVARGTSASPLSILRENWVGMIDGSAAEKSCSRLSSSEARSLKRSCGAAAAEFWQTVADAAQVTYCRHPEDPRRLQQLVSLPYGRWEGSAAVMGWWRSCSWWLLDCKFLLQISVGPSLHASFPEHLDCPALSYSYFFSLIVCLFHSTSYMPITYHTQTK